MRLLVITQALDLDDPLLSAYHGWVAALAREAEYVEAVCLKEGRHALPGNVRVHSLGKERGKRTGLAYALSFLALAWKLRKDYDVVFVHMNEEYVLIAGPLWQLLQKRVYLWRNHYAGSWRTSLAALCCTGIFCTSRASYTARYRKTTFMPVGVDLARFEVPAEVQRVPRSILFFSRLTSSKHPEVLIDALSVLKERDVVFRASFFGSPREGDEDYACRLQERAKKLGDAVSFHAGVTNEKAPEVYQAHEVFVNCSPSGMLDKTVFEAAASGCLVLTESEDMAGFGFSDITYTPGDVLSLAEHIERMLALSEKDKDVLRGRLLDLAKKHALDSLARQLVAKMGGGE